MGGREDGKTGRREDGKTGRREDGKTEGYAREGVAVIPSAARDLLRGNGSPWRRSLAAPGTPARRAPTTKLEFRSGDDYRRPELVLDFGLENKRALVTGSTAGIGLATARLLAAEGAIVTVNGRTERRVSAAVDAIRQHVPAARVGAALLLPDPIRSSPICLPAVA